MVVVSWALTVGGSVDSAATIFSHNAHRHIPSVFTIRPHEKQRTEHRPDQQPGGNQHLETKKE